jgi:hypothetical protein
MQAQYRPNHHGERRWDGRCAAEGISGEKKRGEEDDDK